MMPLAFARRATNSLPIRPVAEVIKTVFWVMRIAFKQAVSSRTDLNDVKNQREIRYPPKYTNTLIPSSLSDKIAEANSTNSAHWINQHDTMLEPKTVDIGEKLDPPDVVFGSLVIADIRATRASVQMGSKRPNALAAIVRVGVFE